MKLAVISLVVGVFLGVLTIYLMLHVVNPLSQDKLDELVARERIEQPIEIYQKLGELVELGVIFDYVEPQRIALVIGTMMGSLVAIFIAAHLVVDKLFFKEFLNPPDFNLAVRRGVLLVTGVIGMHILRFIGVEILLALLPLLLAILVESLIVMIVKRRKQLSGSDIMVLENGERRTATAKRGPALREERRTEILD